VRQVCSRATTATSVAATADGTVRRALQWMIDEASDCTGLSFRKQMLNQLHPEPGDVLHDDCTGFYLHLGPRRGRCRDRRRALISGPAPSVFAGSLVRRSPSAVTGRAGFWRWGNRSAARCMPVNRGT